MPNSKIAPYITMLYKATKGGYQKFTEDIMLAHRAGYEYVNAIAIGKESFFAVFKLDVAKEKSEREYPDAFGLEAFGGFEEEEGPEL